MLSYSSGRNIQSILVTKKYMLFQFLLESDMLDTNLSDDILARKWLMPFDKEICWGL